MLTVVTFVKGGYFDLLTVVCPRLVEPDNKGDTVTFGLTFFLGLSLHGVSLPKIGTSSAFLRLGQVSHPG